MLDTLLDLFHAHRKVVIAAIAAVLALVLHADTAQEVAGAIGVILVGLVPNDQDAVARVYRRRR